MSGQLTQKLTTERQKSFQSHLSSPLMRVKLVALSSQFERLK